MKVYISGPMTGYSNLNVPAFNAASEWLREKGHEPVNPAVVSVPAWGWSDYLRHDIRLLLDCDAILMLRGWQRSKGARLEAHIAEQLAIPSMGELP